MTSESTLSSHSDANVSAMTPESSLYRRLVDRMTPLLIWSDFAAYFAIAAVVAALAPRNGLYVAGFALAAVMLVVWIVARRQLGQSFTAGAHARKLVNTGLFRKFNHPIYYSGTLSYVGIFLALQNWWLLGAWFVYAAAIQVTRMKREDRVLEEAFGDEFRALRKGTWF